MTSVTQQSPGAGNPYNRLYREARPERHASFRVQVDESSDFVTSASYVPDAQKHQRRKIIHGMRPVGRKGRSIDLNMFL